MWWFATFYPTASLLFVFLIVLDSWFPGYSMQSLTLRHNLCGPPHLVEVLSGGLGAARITFGSRKIAVGTMPAQPIHLSQ
jgi:hypothetical protein